MSLRNTLKQYQSCVLLGLFFLAGCQKNTPVNTVDGRNLVNGQDAMANRIIGEGENRFAVLGQRALLNQVHLQKIKLASNQAAQNFLASVASPLPANSLDGLTQTDPTPRDQSLVVGIPVNLLQERYLFGGVIVKVSDTNSTNLGDLKLTDLPPVQVRAAVAASGDDKKGKDPKYVLALLGCTDKCTEASAEEPIISFPVSAVDDANSMVMVDFASVGDGLNLLAMLDPDGSATQLTTKSSKTVSVDYSLSTLVFDVETDMIPKDKDAIKAGVKETVFTTRWYLRLNSAFNSAFEPRPATAGVGFFMTDRSANPVIERQTLPTTFSDEQSAELHYYVKDVPKEFQAAFAGCFDEWNDHFVALTGKKIFSYEFVAADDPKHDLLVPGDIRYHIVEWDLVNQASYGGLGPSIANQFTGEILSSNVLIQGPTIISLYSTWFKVGQQVAEFRRKGDEAAAHNLIQNTQKALDAQFKPAHSFQFRLSAGKNLNFRVASQLPSLEDPAVPRQDFDNTPPDVSYSDYMTGYFHDMLTHELGHNLGLRHNFRGSLYAADGAPTEDKVTVSIMEYLGRDARYLDHVGPYDIMAISYGYTGKKPTITSQYCTDEDAPTPDNLKASAECSSVDESNDPFSWFDARLDHAVDLLVARGQSIAPSWTVAEMDASLTPVITGLGLYAATAADTANHWTNFFDKPDRPSPEPAEVKAYVIAKIKHHLCDPSLVGAIDAKTTQADKNLVTKNLSDLQAKVLKVLAPYKVLAASDLKCSAE